ncbi:MAG: dephospho-CoA kinase [Bacteroidota bacterium]
MSIHVGITGGIGSGKTTICQIFECIGIPVYYADDRAKQLMVEDDQLRQAIRLTFGEESYAENGQLNRTYLANIVFKNPEQLRQLNALVHPAVFQDGIDWQAKHTNAPYTLKEAALLYESGSFRSLDKMICVYAPKKLRLERVMNRDSVSREVVQARMNKQMADREKMMLSNFVITNNGENALVEQVLQIHRTLTQRT